MDFAFRPLGYSVWVCASQASTHPTPMTKMFFLGNRFRERPFRVCWVWELMFRLRV